MNTSSFAELLSIPADQHWRSQAACKSMDSSIFFVEGHQHIEMRTAILICHTCPVEQQCLRHAIINHEHGIWGGKTESQRRRIWLRRAH